MVAAESVMPWQPIDEHRRRCFDEAKGLKQHLLIAAQHALGIWHRLGHLGRTRRKQELGDGVGTYVPMGFVQVSGISSNQICKKRYAPDPDWSGQ